MPVSFTTTRRIEFADTDMAGIVHFANFYRYMEQAEHEFLRSVELSIMMEQPDGTSIGWPRVTASCTFEAPARYDDVLDVRVSVLRIGGKSMTYGFEFHNGPTLVAHGEMRSVCCILCPGKPIEAIEIPREFRERIESGIINDQ